MPSNQSYKQHPENVTLPPISQIFNVPSDGSNSHLSLPPLRAAHSEGNHPSQHSSSRSSRTYSASSLGYPSGAPDLHGSQMMRPRYDQSGAPGGSHMPSHISRSTSYEGYSPSVPSRQPTGMAMPEQPAMHTGRYTGAAPPGYGPSPYSTLPRLSVIRTHRPPRHPEDTLKLPIQGSQALEVMITTRVLQLAHHIIRTILMQQKRPSMNAAIAARDSFGPIHIISHTGDKDYVCPEESCGRRFGVRSNMLRHIRLVHQNNHSHSSGEELRDEWSE
ncbi:hypothetical protein BT96DRAFT_968978 [Gymnopus androsaceus JB14]|uniref:C2H2-type domain-containing protein n=1 Tax=Gymnopus androsaceus JB14 TaxID=1447944 RepID=A0A6A4IQU1_9AGAR|nr:hypothetical protein BT96DRAFT_968978 [Gymnopus androsaceus JB14]